MPSPRNRDIVPAVSYASGYTPRRLTGILGAWKGSHLRGLQGALLHLTRELSHGLGFGECSIQDRGRTRTAVSVLKQVSQGLSQRVLFAQRYPMRNRTSPEP